jgi:RimJ/RimL family protein N-acetyltransferase
VVADGEDAGSVGYWEQRWNGEDIWEMGWSILPEHQGRGLATAAAALVIERTRKDGRFRYVHAFPSIENRASNAICRKLGFESQGTVDFEYPVGNPMKSIDWRFDLLDLQQRPIRE